jgi:hypothetical protein
VKIPAEDTFALQQAAHLHIHIKFHYEQPKITRMVQKSLDDRKLVIPSFQIKISIYIPSFHLAYRSHIILLAIHNHLP